MDVELTGDGCKDGGKDALYTKFIQTWTPRFTLLAFQHGFTACDLEDKVAQLFMDFFEGDYLRIYDPEKASFSTFVHSFAIKRLKGYRDKENRRRIREVSADKRNEETGELIIDAVVFYQEGAFDTIDISHALKDVIRQAQIVSCGSSRKLGTLVLVMLKQLRAIGEVDKKALANFFGVSEASIRLWLEDIRFLPATKALKCGDYYDKCSLSDVRQAVTPGVVANWY